MSAYLLGVATPFVVAFTGWLILNMGTWVAWWFLNDRPGFYGRKGFCHEVNKTQHTHYWPPDTPWWLIRIFEPARVHFCRLGEDER